MTTNQEFRIYRELDFLPNDDINAWERLHGTKHAKNASCAGKINNHDNSNARTKIVGKPSIILSRGIV